MRVLVVILAGLLAGSAISNAQQYKAAAPLRQDAEKWQRLQTQKAAVLLHRPTGTVVIKLPWTEKPVILPRLCAPSMAL